MTRRLTLTLAAAALLPGSMQLVAHDDKIHKATVGIVATATSEGLDLKTKDGIVKVKYSSKTKFELHEKASEKSAVKVGDRVGVLGSKQPTGEIMANEVILGVPAPKADAEKKAEHKH